MNDNLLVKIAEAQGRFEAKLDSYLERQRDHEKRIGKLERHWTRVFTWFTVIGTTVSVAVKFLFTGHKP